MHYLSRPLIAIIGGLFYIIMKKELINILKNFGIGTEKERVEIVLARIENAVEFKGTNLWILVFAIFIASLGLNVNSTAVIIGAMLVSPLMGPIMGLGLGVGINDLELLKKAIKNHLFATIIGLLASTIYFLISPLSEAHSEILSRTQPNIYDVLIALFGGFAGIVATNSKNKGNVLTGVAIATALMPPLCTAGYGLATLNFNYFIGAFYLYFINTVFIAFATFIGVKLLNFPIKHLTNITTETRTKRIIFLMLLVAIVPSIYLGYNLIQQSRYQSKAKKFIENECKIENDYLLNRTIDAQKEIITLVYGGAKIEDEKISKIKNKLAIYGLKNTKLNINQGFLSQLSIENKLDKDTQIISLQIEHEQLQKKVDSLNLKKDFNRNIFQEVKILFPSLIEMIIQPSLSFNNTEEDSIIIVYLKFSNKIKLEERTRLENWLNKRLNSDKTKIIIE